MPSFKEVFNNIRSVLSSIKKEEHERIGELAKDIIYKRVKSGKGVSSDKAQKPGLERLKPLGHFGRDRSQARSSYIERRKKTSLGPFGKPGKSNLTLTGQMLEAMIVKVRRNGFTIDIKNNNRDDSKSTNKEIANYVSKQGRPFLALAKNEQVIVQREYEKVLRKIISRL